MDKPLKPCPEPGCPNLIRTGLHHSARCPDHMTKSPYDAAWRRRRKEKLARDPWCQGCGVFPADEVDHIVPVRAGGSKLAWSNLRSLCLDCHRKVTPREYHFRRKSIYWRSRERTNRAR